MTAFRVTPAELMGLSQQVQRHGRLDRVRAGRPAQPGAADGRHLDRAGSGPLPGPVRRVEPQRAGPPAGPGRHQPLLAQAGQSYDEAERRIAGTFAG